MVSVEKPRFTWTAVPNVTGYAFVLWTAAGVVHWQTTIAAGTSQVDYAGPGLANGESYRWRVTANFAAPTPPQHSGTYTFTKVPAGAMEPTLVSPENGVNLVIGKPTFNWAPPPGGTPLEYRVEVRDGVGTLIWTESASSSATSVQYAGPALRNDATYRWRVIAVHIPPNPPAPSAESTFTKRLIEAPLLVSPPNGGGVSCAANADGSATFVFAWTAVANFQDTGEYIIEVHFPLNTILWSRSVAPPSTSVSVSPSTLIPCTGDTYWWRVASVAKDDATPSWSIFWSFVR